MGVPVQFCLWLGGGGVEEVDAIEAQGLAELGEGGGAVGEEEGVNGHVAFEGQAAFVKGGGQEVVIGQAVFVLVAFGAGEEAAASVEHIEHGEKSFAGRKPAVGRGIQLPAFAGLRALPATDGGAHREVGLGMRAVIFAGPTAALGPGEGEVAQAQDFAGGEAVVGGRRRGAAFVEECDDVGGPVGGVIAARGAGRPAGVTFRPGAQGVGVKFVEATAGKLEFGGSGVRVELLGAELGQDVTD